MDNDTLIDQARNLYAALLVKKYRLTLERKSPSESQTNRLNEMVGLAYGRYLRRLNRCAICYQQRLHDCNREPGKDHTPCAFRQSSCHGHTDS